MENIYFRVIVGWCEEKGIQQQCQVHDVSICLPTLFVGRQTDICNENVLCTKKIYMPFLGLILNPRYFFCPSGSRVQFLDPARSSSVILLPDFSRFSFPLQHHWRVFLVLPFAALRKDAAIDAEVDDQKDGEDEDDDGDDANDDDLDCCQESPVRKNSTLLFFLIIFQTRSRLQSDLCRVHLLSCFNRGRRKQEKQKHHLISLHCHYPNCLPPPGTTGLFPSLKLVDCTDACATEVLLQLPM